MKAKAIKRAMMLMPYGKKPTTPEDRQVLNQILINQCFYYRYLMGYFA